jgi:acyl-CoA thioesterase-1
MVESFGRRMLAVLAVGMCLCGAAIAQETVQGKPAKPIKLAVLGDSLTAGLGLPLASAFPAKLEAALRARNLDVTVINAGVSGDTSSDGLARLDWSIPQDTDAVIVELGANDALRAIDPKLTRNALDEIVKRLRQRDVAVMLAGMYAPRNFGAEYSAQFDPIYPDLAKAYDVPLYPFFLDGVATDRALNQADGLHPTAAGVNVIVERMLPTVEAWLTKVAARRR